MNVSRRTFCSSSASAGFALVLGLGALAKDDKSKKPPKTGNYKLEIRGYFEGTGTAVVAASGVTITGNVKDESGRKGTFVVNNVKVSNNRFSGSGTAVGVKVDISGRVDSASGTVKVGRVTCTYQTLAGRYGRISGELQSP